MAKAPVPLNETKIKSLKSKDKSYSISDGKGLQLLIKTTGSKLWEFRFTSPVSLKRRKTSFGLYPVTSLKSARDKCISYLKMIDNGIDPLEEKHEKINIIKKEKVTEINTFKKVSLDWLENYKSEVSENYHNKITRALELYTYSYIGDKPIIDVTRLDLIEILQDLKNKDLKETANRTFMLLNKVFMHATTHELIPHNITADIDKKVILGKSVKKHYPTFTKEKDIKGLLLAIDSYSGDYTTKIALKILPYLFVRSYNIRHCEWSEIDFNNRLWIIPANKMKTKTEFQLPLPSYVIQLLQEIQDFSGSDKYVFPSFRSKNTPMSDNTLIAAIRRMGYTKEEFVPHGFRAMFSTIAYEKANEDNGHTYTGEVIEALLAHKEVNKVKEAYNRATFVNSMRGLITWYANYLNEIKNGQTANCNLQ